MRHWLRRGLWIAFYAVDALLVALFGLAYASGYLPFGTWWWAELLAIGTLYLGLALVPAAVVAGLGRRWWLLGLHVVLLLLLAGRAGLPGRLLPGPAARPGDLTVLTFNTPGARVTPEALLDVVRRAAPEVVCLQEVGSLYWPGTADVDTKAYARVLMDSLGYKAPDIDARGAIYTPQLILSRIPAEVVDVTELKAGPEDTTFSHLTRARLQWQGRWFALYNVRLRSFGARKPWREDPAARADPDKWRSYLAQYREAFRLRAEEAKQIRALLEREALPVVLCGDLNSTPYNRVYTALDPGLRDAYRAAGAGWGMTYHSRLPLFRIDYVLAGPAWEVVAARAVPGQVSDHRPVVVHLRWRD